MGRAHLLRTRTRVDRVEGPGHLPVRTGHQPAHLGHWNVGAGLRESAGSRRLHHMGRDPGQPGPGRLQRPAGSSPRRRLRPGRARGPGDRQPQAGSQSGRLGRAGSGRRCRVVVDPAPTRARRSPTRCLQPHPGSHGGLVDRGLQLAGPRARGRSQGRLEAGPARAGQAPARRRTRHACVPGA